MSDVISRQQLLELVDAWIAQDKRAIGPVAVGEDLHLFMSMSDSGQLAMEGYIRPQNSIKEFFFPRHEKIYRYHFKGHNIELEDVEPPATEQLIIGARPCDAAALPILDHVFNWDFKDEFYNQRRNATTVITLACATFDDNCFCTSVGLSPAAEQGSDALLLSIGDDGYEVRCLTDKGKALFEDKTQSSEKTGEVIDGPEKKFDPEPIGDFVRNNFENPVWQEIALRCLGCGVCTYSCPTCHCFDIVDEGTASGGARVKNWDSCQFAMFTQHASGHNPRANQIHRQRQRLLHKFGIYPEKFGAILCTGCGNCMRNCPVELGVLNSVEILREAATRNTGEGK